MTAHLHATFIEGCYRCDLGRDEAYVPPHDCNTDLFDRIACPEPCGIMHTLCTVCHESGEPCGLDES